MRSLLPMAADWHEWHRAYDEPDSPLSRRLAIVQDAIRAALDAAPPGEIRVVSMCAGEGRDILGVLADHPRAADVRGRLVELDAGLAATARAHAPAGIEVLVGDAGLASSYTGAVPADVVLMCGVFGNIADTDVENTVRHAASLCAPGATVIWTRHRRPPDGTPQVRALVPRTRLRRDRRSSGPRARCSASARNAYERTRSPSTRPRATSASSATTLSATRARRAASRTTWAAPRSPPGCAPTRARSSSASATFDDTAVRTRPAPDVWSPLEYACHVRDVLRVQRGASRASTRTRTSPRSRRCGATSASCEDRYNEQDPRQVAQRDPRRGRRLRRLPRQPRRHAAHAARRSTTTRSPSCARWSGSASTPCTSCCITEWISALPRSPARSRCAPSGSGSSRRPTSGSAATSPRSRPCPPSARARRRGRSGCRSRTPRGG